MTGMNISNLQQVHDFLEEQGFEAELNENSAVTHIGEFPTVVTLNDEQLTISTQLCLLGDIPASRQADFLLAAADLNSRILPFAVAVITSSDNEDLSDPDTFPVVLIDSMPVGDLHPDELSSVFTSLRTAIMSSRPVLEIGFSNLEGTERRVPGVRRSHVRRSEVSGLATRLGFDFEELALLLVEFGFLLDDGTGYLPEEDLLIDEPIVNPVAETEVVEPIQAETEEESAFEERPVFTEEPAFEPDRFSSGSSFDSGGNDFEGSDD